MDLSGMDSGSKLCVFMSSWFSTQLVATTVSSTLYTYFLFYGS